MYLHGAWLYDLFCVSYQIFYGNIVVYVRYAQCDVNIGLLGIKQATWSLCLKVFSAQALNDRRMT